MDSAMRDLEQIRERDDEGEGRPLGVGGAPDWGDSALVLRDGEPRSAGATTRPRWRRTIRSHGSTGRRGWRRGRGARPSRSCPRSSAARLTFPEALAPADERPEVAAALAAAAAELAHPDPLARLAPTATRASHRPGAPGRAARRGRGRRRAPKPSPHRGARSDGRDGAARAHSEPTGLERPRRRVHRAGDQLRQPRRRRRAFAAGLRARGHHAFVMRAEVEGRGTVLPRARRAVREPQREAQAYRREFERTERMNTLSSRRAARRRLIRRYHRPMEESALHALLRKGQQYAASDILLRSASRPPSASAARCTTCRATSSSPSRPRTWRASCSPGRASRAPSTTCSSGTPRTRCPGSAATASTSTGSAAPWRSRCAPSRCASPPSRSCASRTVVRKLAELERGMVLVCGAAGNGKSSTLAAMIGHLNQTRRCARGDHRGPDRVHPSGRLEPDLAARGGARHRRLRHRAARRAAAVAGRDPGRRDPRRGDDGHRAEGGGDGPPAL